MMTQGGGLNHDQVLMLGILNAEILNFAKIFQIFADLTIGKIVIIWKH